jgi:hypothetical protein
MPLTSKGQTIMAAFKRQYGEEEGERNFYKSKNAGTITGVDRWMLSTAALDLIRARERGDTLFGDDTYNPETGEIERTSSYRRNRKTVQRDPFGREVATFEEDRHMSTPLFSMLGTTAPFFSVVGDAAPRVTVAQLYDQIEIDDGAKVAFTKDGFLKAQPRIARTGIQLYGGDEVGVAMDVVRVYRPERAVFDNATIKTYTHLPTTLEHPSEPVTAANWKDHATGETGDEVLRDGGTVRVPMMLRDAKAIAAWKDGSKKQLSVGYTCDLKWQSGVIPAGQPCAGERYDAIQDNIRANHLAQCAAARGGPILTIGDTKENNMTSVMGASLLKTVMVDGIACEMTDTAAQLVQKTIAMLTDQAENFKKKKSEAEEECKDAAERIKKLDGEIKAKDAEIVVLKKGIDDAKLKPEQLDALVKDRQIVFDSARRILSDGYKFDGKTVEDVRRDAVNKHLGDTAKAWDDNQIRAGFDSIIALMPKDGRPIHRQGSMDHAVSAFAGRPGWAGDNRQLDPQAIRDAAYSESVRELNDAWKPQAVRDAEAAARRAAGGY